MADRVRTRPVRRAPLPNIRAAGRSAVRTEPAPQNIVSEAPSRGRGHSDNRGRGRGRGRGATRGRGGHSGIVQAEAIFTAGLDENIASRNRTAGHFGEEQIVGRIERREGPGDYVQNGERVKKEIKAENGHITRELTTYELEWQSDNEFDDDELKGLISDGFLSDVKKAKDGPVVLPARDTEQFSQLVRRPSSKRESKFEPMEVDLNVKMEVSSQCTSESEFERLSQLGKCEASDIVRDYIRRKENSFLLFQLPASLANFKQGPSSEETPPEVKVEVKQEPGESSSAAQEKVQEKLDDQKTKTPHCLDGFSANSEIGKVQILKSGKVRLIIGGRPMDLQPAIASNLNEVIVNVDSTHPESTTYQPQPPNELRVLGNVQHSLLCSYNYNTLLNKPPL